MAFNGATVNGEIRKADNTIPQNATINFQITNFDAEAATNVAVYKKPVSAAINPADGTFTIELFPSNSGTRATQYEVTVRDFDAVKGFVDFSLGVAEVPDDTQTYDLADILTTDGGNSPLVTALIDSRVIVVIDQNAQANALDATDGKLFRMDGVVGPFGLGSQTAPVITNLNATDVRTGFYRAIGAGTSGTFPPGANQFGCVLIFRYDQNDFMQVYYGVTTDGLWSRRYRASDGGFFPWQRLDNYLQAKEVFTTIGTSVTLTDTPVDVDHVDVFFDGLLQNPAEYTLVNNNVNFTGGAPSGVTEIIVSYFYY